MGRWGTEGGAEGGGALEPAVRALRGVLERFETEEARLRGLAYEVRAGDVFIATPPKCGTTWMQQVVHGLRTGGSMDFEEISNVIPCVEFAGDCNIDLDAPQVASPRVFKTHSWRPHCPRGPGAKYIVVVRDPLDTTVSFFHFMEGWFFPPGALSLSEFVRELVLKRGAPPSKMHNASYWDNVASWWPHRNDPDVLWVHFEDMKEDLAGVVARVADFLGVGAGDAALQALVVRQASLEFMKAHKDKFDEHVMKGLRNEACGLPASAGRDNAKVREGRVGSREALPADIRAELEARWAQLEALTGCASYDALRAQCSVLRRP